MAPIALGSPIIRPTHLRKVHQEELDGFGTRAIHVGSDPDPNTGAVIPAISLSTTYKQDSVGHHKVSLWFIMPLRMLLVPDTMSHYDRASSILGLVIPTGPPLNALSRLWSRVVHMVWLSPLDQLQRPRFFSPSVLMPISSV